MAKAMGNNYLEDAEKNLDEGIEQTKKSVNGEEESSEE